MFARRRVVGSQSPFSSPLAAATATSPRLAAEPQKSKWDALAAEWVAASGVRGTTGDVLLSALLNLGPPHFVWLGERAFAVALLAKRSRLAKMVTATKHKSGCKGVSK